MANIFYWFYLVSFDFIFIFSLLETILIHFSSLLANIVRNLVDIHEYIRINFLFNKLASLFIESWLVVCCFIRESLSPIIINKYQVDTIATRWHLVRKLHAKFLLFVIFIESVIHQLLILKKLNLLRILGSFLQFIANVAFDLIFKLFHDFKLLDGLFFFHLVLWSQLLKARVANFDKNIEDAHESGDNC